MARAGQEYLKIDDEDVGRNRMARGIPAVGVCVASVGSRRLAFFGVAWRRLASFGVGWRQKAPKHPKRPHDTLKAPHDAFQIRFT